MVLNNDNATPEKAVKSAERLAATTVGELISDSDGLEACSSQAPGLPPKVGWNATNPRSLFGSKKEAKKQPQFTHLNPHDYEQKYPRDAFGEERAHDARVWLTYLDEAELYDRDKIDGWNDTINILLVFIGIFSAIVSTFLSQTTQSLQQDYTQVTASLMFEMVQLQRAFFTGASITDVPSSTLTPNSPFTPSVNASLVNGLWLTSLAISLCTALIAALTKQWLYYYSSPISGTAREKARVRHFRFEGLEKWRVELIIDLLPALLHLALGIFLIGLNVFVFPLDARIVWVIIVLSGSTYILYFVSILLPVRYPQCPYVTPLTIYAGFFIHTFRHILSSISLNYTYLMRLSLHRDKLLSKSIPQQFRILYVITLRKSGQIWIILKHKLAGLSWMRFKGIPRDARAWRVSQLAKSIEEEAFLNDKAIHWLGSISSSPSVTRIISRTIYKSLPGFYTKICLPLDISAISQFAKTLRENPSHITSVEPNFVEDILYFLYIGLGLRRYRVYNASAKLQPVQKYIKAYYPDLSNAIDAVTDSSSHNSAKTLLKGFQDNDLRYPEVVWFRLLYVAHRQLSNRFCEPNEELVSKIISSGTFDLFTWSKHSFLRARRSEASGPVSLITARKLGGAAFRYLCFFFFEHAECEDSLESRYLLLVKIYENLVSDKPLIEDEEHREKAFRHLFDTFSRLISIRHECIQGQVITSTFLNGLQRDILFQGSFTDRLPLSVQTSALRCFTNFWEYRMEKLGQYDHFFSARDEELQFIYRWYSNIDYDSDDRALSAIGTLIQKLFIPDNLSKLCTLLQDGLDNAGSNFGNHLRYLLWSAKAFDWDYNFQTRKRWVLYNEYVIPNVIYIYENVSSANPLLPAFYNPSVLAEAWVLVMTYFSEAAGGSRLSFCAVDRAWKFATILTSKVDRSHLEKVHRILVEKCLKNDDKWWTYKLCASTHYFERMTNLFEKPAGSASELSPELSQLLPPEDVAEMQKDYEERFRIAKPGSARFSISEFGLLNGVLKAWRREKPETQAV